MPKRKRNPNLLWLSRLIFLAFFAIASQAADVIIHLRNGDRVTGAIEAETATEVTIRSGTLGKIVIPVGEILRREGVTTPAPTTNTVTTGAPATPAPTTNAVAVTAPTPSPAPAPAPVVKPPKPKRWNSEFQFGVNLRYTTKDQQEALVIAKSTYANGRFREILDYNFSWGETEGIQSANRMFGSAKSEWDITPKIYLFGLAGAGYDEIRLIDWQWELNPGMGYQWIKKPDFVFKTEIGLGYQDQYFDNDREVKTYSGRLAAIFTWRIWDKLLADGKAEYFPDVRAIDEYRFRFESTLRYPLLKNVSLNLVVIDLYDTQAPPGVENNDLQVRSAIGVKF